MPATRCTSKAKKYVLHTIPSGIFRDGSINIIGNGVVVDPVILAEEITQLEKDGVDVQSKLLISKKAHLILPTHRIIDAASEAAKGKTKIGSTLKGIGPTYMDKTGRNGLRIGDIVSGEFTERYNRLKEKHIELLKQYDFAYDISEYEKSGSKESKHSNVSSSSTASTLSTNCSTKIKAFWPKAHKDLCSTSTLAPILLSPHPTPSVQESAPVSVLHLHESVTYMAFSKPTAPVSAAVHSQLNCSMQMVKPCVKSVWNSAQPLDVLAVADGSIW